MFRSSVLAAAAFGVIAGPLCAQSFERRASMRGGGDRDEGKCTVEVVVDGAADVEIRGDVGRLRNLSGRPAEWRRFECNGVLPPNPVDFRFIGIDGRGRQQLIRDPRNGGFAVVRIEDPNGGAEGYTFDLTWNARMGPPGPYRNPNERRGRYTAEEAVRVCQDAIRQQAAQRFRAPDIEFRSTAMDDSPGRNDWVIGLFEVRRRDGPGEMHRFSCSVNFDNGEVRSAQIEANDGPRYPPGGPVSLPPGSPVIRACQQAVEQRLRQDGYRRLSFGPIGVDDRPGRNDWIGGVATARRKGREDSYDFSCSVDLRRGVVRSVDVRPR